MKILERKDWEKSWSWQCTCPQCESKLEAESKDLGHTPGWGGELHDRVAESFIICCPVCTKIIPVAPAEIPAYIAKLARDRAFAAQSFPER